MTDQTALGELRRGWPAIVAALFGITFGVTALFFYSVGIFLKPIAAEFGWSRASLSAVSLVAGLSLAVTSPVIGWIVDRVGIRKVVLASGFGLALGFLMLSRTPASLPIYLCLIGLAILLGCGASPVVYTRLVNQRFDKARGTALGLAQIATGLAGAIMPLLLLPLIAAEGWRAGYLALAIVSVISAPIAFLLVGAQGGKVSQQGERAPLRGGLTLREALRDRTFVGLAIVLCLAAYGIGGLIVHLVPLLTDAGLSPARAGVIASFMGLSIIAGRVLTGMIVDRVFAPRVATMIFCTAGLGCLLLAWGGAPLAPLAAVLVGLAMGAEVDLISYFVARYFGLKAYGQIYGWLYAIFMVGSSVGPVITGALFDHFGDYRAGVAILGLCLILSGLAAFRLGPFRTFPAQP